MTTIGGRASARERNDAVVAVEQHGGRGVADADVDRDRPDAGVVIGIAVAVVEAEAVLAQLERAVDERRRVTSG